MSEWPISMWKDARHHRSLGKCKSKGQGDTTAHRSGWLHQNHSKQGWQRCGETGTLVTVGRNRKCHCYCGKLYGSLAVPQKIKNRIDIWPSNSTSEHTCPKELKVGSWRDICTRMFLATVFTTAKRQKQPKGPSLSEWISKAQYTRNGMLLSLWEKGNSAACYNMDQPWGRYAE